LPRAAPEAAGVTPFIANFMRKNISGLVTAGLFSVQPLAGPSKRIKARCGLFGVEKAGKKSAAGRPLARVVFDARGANKYFEPLPFALVIFTLFMLLDAMYLFCHGYAYSVDMRRYYYQWKLGGRHVVGFRSGGRYVCVPSEGSGYGVPRCMCPGTGHVVGNRFPQAAPFGGG